MIKYRFANYDREAITEVLERIGKVRFEKTLANTSLKKPTEMKNFKLLWEGRTCAVMYKYPGDFRYTKLFLIKDYEMPEKGWIWENYRD